MKFGIITTGILLFAFSPLCGLAATPEVKTTIPEKKEKCDIKFKKLNLCGELKWVVPPKKVEMPTEKDKSEFLLSLSKPEKSAIPKRNSVSLEDLDLSVHLWMPSMGHGSEPTQVQREKDSAGKDLPGSYRVKNLYFTMAGDWDIQIEIKKNGKTLDKAIVQTLL